MNKYFIITVDTEGEGLWNWKPGEEICTHNAKAIPKFQELCEKYNFKPVYLVNYEMANDDYFVQYIKPKAMEAKCEIGMHLHAWNTPPEYSLENKYDGNPYITEYPDDIIEAKVKTTIELLQNRFEVPVYSHRSGRWATNDILFDILAKYGIKVDCSVTPELNLSRIPGCSAMCGNDYSKFPKSPFMINKDILEVPMTTRKYHHFKGYSIKNKIKNLIKGQELWLRPIKTNIENLKTFTRSVIDEGDNYLEFMIHSSELIPGGSPYFKDITDIEKCFNLMDEYFCFISNKGYCGKTLNEYKGLYEF